MTEKATVEELVPEDVNNFKYHPMSEGEGWKIAILQEIIETLQGNINISEFEHDELEDMLEYLCTS